MTVLVGKKERIFMTNLEIFFNYIEPLRNKQYFPSVHRITPYFVLNGQPPTSSPNSTSPSLLFCDRRGYKVPLSVLYVSFFRDSRVNVASFSRRKIPFNRTRLYLVTVFYKVRCSQSSTKVVT